MLRVSQYVTDLWSVNSKNKPATFSFPVTLVPDNSVLPFKYYNVEITDIMGTPAGTFTSGDNICRDNTMITHNPRNPFSSNARLFTWMPPNRDVGSLFIR